MVATAPNLTVEAIGGDIPDDIMRLAPLLKAATNVTDLGKRDMEEHIADTLVGPDAPAAFVRVREDVLNRLANADWRALSAERAERLLHEKLWDRVYALRVRGFAQNYPNAELDMHFSLSQDMTPLKEFLQIYKDGGMQLIMSKLSRGDI